MSQATAGLGPADPHLIDRSRAYEHEALEEVFARTFDAVYTFCHALAGDHLEAETLTGQTFLRLLEVLPSHDDPAGDLETWVLRLAAEVSGRRSQPPGDRLDLREALVQLGHAEHEVLTLRLVAGLESGALAAATGRRLSAVQSLQLNALRDLRSNLGRRSLRRVSPPNAERELDQALDRLRAGQRLESVADSCPRLPDGRDLLECAASILALPGAQAPAAARSRARTLFLATAEEKRALWVHRHHLVAGVPGVRRAPRQPVRVGQAAALVLLMVLAVLAGLVTAAASVLSDPDSPFYPLKRAGEAVLVDLTRNPVSRADFEVKLSQTRTREAETMAFGSKGDLAVPAVRAHFDALRAAARDLIATPVHDARWTQVRDRLEVEASKPVTDIERELDSSGFKEQAQEVRAANEQFQNDRKQIDPRLGKPVPVPLPVPSVSPVAGSRLSDAPWNDAA